MRHQVKVISVENMNKNPKSFSGISPVQKEDSPLINYKNIYLSDRILLTEKKKNPLRRNY